MRRFGVYFCLFVSVVAQQKSPEDLANSTNAHIRKHAYVLSKSMWTQPDHEIYVCWENPDPLSDDGRKIVQEAIESTWQKYSVLRFTGWQKCAVKNRGIRILIDDSGPHTKGLGHYLDGVRNGMVLNFTFQNWSPSCRSRRNYCIWAIAVHEFGHAIGFAHEQNSPKAPGECQALRQGTDGDILLTPYDPQSVMNYCNAKYNNDGKLSPLDIEAVQTLYGKPS